MTSTGVGIPTHDAPTRWNPALHTKSHWFALHTGLAFGGAAAHGLHDAPHWVTLVSLAHCSPGH
jgi:hypothetical protein